MNPSASNFRPGSALMATSVVELRIACRNLKDKDVFSKSDPMCVVLKKEAQTGNYVQIFRTEVIKDTLNPDFVKHLSHNYNFEERQLLRFDVYDSDCARDDRLDQTDFLGRMECSLGEVVAAQGSQFKRKLTGKGNCGEIIVYSEEVTDCKKMLKLQFSGTKLDKKDFFGKSDPFLMIFKCNEDNSSVLVSKSEVIKRNLNPIWRPMDIPLRVLCGGDLDRTIRVHCFDWDKNGSHDLIGEISTNTGTLLKGPCAENIYPCINLKKKTRKKSYKHSGLIRVLACTQYQEHTFLDFIQGGTQMHFTVAIDFTASNEDPKLPTSLHYMSPKQVPNAYMMAIRAVGDIIADFDSDKLFPALGFGAKLPPEGLLSHEFALNGSPSNPYCAGVEGILEAYQRAIRSVQLFGPTNFAPVIRHVTQFAEASTDGSAYFVLLIITDGIITDIEDTKKAIIHASSLPLSLIIVGVGQADFSAMEELDADRCPLSVNGRVAERDIVQFVPMRDILLANQPWQTTQAKLAKEVLAEIPGQLTAYMKKHQFVPKARR